jgi:hypothetical protein
MRGPGDEAGAKLESLSAHAQIVKEHVPPRGSRGNRRRGTRALYLTGRAARLRSWPRTGVAIFCRCATILAEAIRWNARCTERGLGVSPEHLRLEPRSANARAGARGRPSHERKPPKLSKQFGPRDFLSRRALRAGERQRAIAGLHQRHGHVPIAEHRCGCVQPFVWPPAAPPRRRKTMKKCTHPLFSHPLFSIQY